MILQAFVIWRQMFPALLEEEVAVLDLDQIPSLSQSQNLNLNHQGVVLLASLAIMTQIWVVICSSDASMESKVDLSHAAERFTSTPRRGRVIGLQTFSHHVSKYHLLSNFTSNFNQTIICRIYQRKNRFLYFNSLNRLKELPYLLAGAKFLLNLSLILSLLSGFLVALLKSKFRFAFNNAQLRCILNKKT